MSTSGTPPLEKQVQRILDNPKMSSLQKYAALAVGHPSRWKLLKYEWLTGWFSSWPGAVGYFLRRKAYRSLFASMGRGVTIGRNVTLRGTGRISLGKGVFIDDNCCIDARGEGASIHLGDGVFIGRNTVVRCRGERIDIGAGSEIGTNCLVTTSSRLTIGRDVMVAAFAYIAAGGLHRYKDLSVPMIRQGFDSRGGISIGDDVWIGAHSFLQDGAIVGTGVIIGAHSLVNKPVPDYAIVYGIPATVRGSRRTEPAG